MISRREGLVLALCALLMAAVGGGALFYNWVSTDPFTADCLPDDRITIQEYEVYAALLNRIVADEWPQARGWHHALIAPSTIPIPAASNVVCGWNQSLHAGDFSEISTLTGTPVKQIGNLLRVSSRAYSLRPLFFGTQIPYSLADCQFNTADSTRALWPYNPHCYAFSRVAFSPEMDSAVLCCAFEGRLQNLYLVKMVLVHGHWVQRFPESWLVGVASTASPSLQ